METHSELQECCVIKEDVSVYFSDFVSFFSITPVGTMRGQGIVRVAVVVLVDGDIFVLVLVAKIF